MNLAGFSLLSIGVVGGIAALSTRGKPIQSIQNAYRGAATSPYSSMRLPGNIGTGGRRMQSPTVRQYGPGYDTVATRYSLDQAKQDQAQSNMMKSTEGLPLAMYQLRKRGYL